MKEQIIKLGIEDISDEATRTIFIDFQEAFNNLLNNPSFDINLVDEIHSKTWDENPCDMTSKKILSTNKIIKDNELMNRHLLITNIIKYFVYRKNKKDYIYDYSLKELPIGDFYVFQDDGYYAINLISDMDSIGYDKNYYRTNYNCGSKLFFCEAIKYTYNNNDNNDVKADKTISFIYDADNKKTLDILGLSVYFDNSNDNFLLTKDSLNSEWKLLKVNK